MWEWYERMSDLAKSVVNRKLGRPMENAAMGNDLQDIDVRLQPALPESYPLRTLDELEELSFLDSFHFPFNKSSVPLPIHKRINDRTSERPRLLVCHDMKGGYQDDRWVQGSPNGDAYSIWHWHLIDIFVYFSHSLVTLPPPCWVNAAHRHGVQVLGTFITEWDAGKALCRRLLASKESVFLYASRLTKLAEVLGFDGWLINIENEVEKHHINNLLEFVRLLTKLMHDRVPGSTVIWYNFKKIVLGVWVGKWIYLKVVNIGNRYDSVTKDGALRWQNCLNELNKCFFDLCDGIFTNYTWKEGHLKTSAATAGETRRYDVYMGIDVFGRNTYGGGGFQSNVGLLAARDAGVSAALFAPGWVYETEQSSSFLSAQNRWWGLVAECWRSAQQYPLDLPFFSNFNQGFWKEYFEDGSKVSTTPWSNISCQNLQPLLRLESGALKGEISGECHVYSGGACVKFSGSIDEDSQCLTTLYEANVEIDTPFDVIYTVRSNNDSSLSLLLRMSNKDSDNYIVLGMKEVDEVNSSPASNIVLLRPQKVVQHPKGWSLCEYRVENPGKLEGIIAVSYSNKQRVSDFIKNFLSGKSSRLPEEVKISEGLSMFPYEAFLGHIAISTTHEHNFHKEEMFEQPFEISDVFWEEVSGKRVVSLKLTWKHKASTFSEIMNYNIFVCKGTTAQENFEHLGVAMVEAFYVSQLDVPESCQALTFSLQTVCKCGRSGTLDMSPAIGIEVPRGLSDE